MIKGSCLCGAINIQIKGKITDIIHCHCSLCRKNSGTAYATNGFVNSDDFQVIKGKESLKEFVFKPGRVRHFCTHCGSPMFSSNASDVARLRVRLGCIDSNIESRPISHNFVTSKADWEDMDAKLPRHDGFEPGRE